MPKPQICPQGEFDGACFLYSIVNAYKTLSGKRPTLKMWDKAIRTIPFKEKFITNDGTLFYDDNMELYKFTISKILTGFSKKNDGFLLEAYPHIENTKKLNNLIDENSVLIFCVDGDHWVVGVEVDKNYIYLADSYKYFSDAGSYHENKSVKFKRFYNSKIDLKKDGWIYNPSFMQIRMVEA